MLRISALNDSSSSEEDCQKIQQTKTKEAKEAEAFAAYNKALSHQQKGNTLHAEKLLRNLFDHPLLKEASSLADDENQRQILNHPGLQLLYSIQKNLASILLQRGQLHEAVAAYIEAVKIDSSEVTVWFKMGQIARELHNYPLAKICFQQALQCNPNHWPSLDNAITMTYALGDYLMCLENISIALEKDYSYPKGLSLMKKILFEHPSLESLTKELFMYCDSRINSITVDQEETKEYVNEALKIRAKRRQMFQEYQEKELRPHALLEPLTPFTWSNVGEKLIDFYDYAVKTHMSLALEVDLRDYYFLDQMAFLGESLPPDKPANMSGAVKDAQPIPNEGKKTAQDLTTGSEVTGFQRAIKQAESVHLVPQSLNIKDAARESALIRRIQRDLAHSDTTFTAHSGLANIISTPPPPSSQLAEGLVPDDLELEAMDVSDVPLLPEEDINMAVLGLKDFRKAEFRPELLLKENDEDMPDARSLENVLSSVIDMEMQAMYQKDVKQDEALKKTPEDVAYAYYSLGESAGVQISVARETEELLVNPQDKLQSRSSEGFESVETALNKTEDLMETSLPAAQTSTTDDFSTNAICKVTETNTLSRVVGSVSSSSVSATNLPQLSCSTPTTAQHSHDNHTTQTAPQDGHITPPLRHTKDQSSSIHVKFSPAATQPPQIDGTNQTALLLNAHQLNIAASFPVNSANTESPQLTSSPSSRTDASFTHQIPDHHGADLSPKNKVLLSTSHTQISVHTQASPYPPTDHVASDQSFQHRNLYNNPSHSPQPNYITTASPEISASDLLPQLDTPGGNLVQTVSLSSANLSNKDHDVHNLSYPTHKTYDSHTFPLPVQIYLTAAHSSKDQFLQQTHASLNPPSSVPTSVKSSEQAHHTLVLPAQIPDLTLRSSSHIIKSSQQTLHGALSVVETSQETSPISIAQSAQHVHSVHSSPSLIQTPEQVLHEPSSPVPTSQRIFQISQDAYSSPAHASQTQGLQGSPLHAAHQVCNLQSSPVPTPPQAHSSQAQGLQRSPLHATHQACNPQSSQVPTPPQAHAVKNYPVHTSQQAHSLLSSLVHTSQQAHSLLSSPALTSQQAHSLLSSPVLTSQKTHSPPVHISQQAHNQQSSSSLTSQKAHSKLSSPVHTSQQTHNLQNSPVPTSQKVHEFTGPTSQQPHGMKSSPIHFSQQVHGIQRSPVPTSEHAHGLPTSPIHISPKIHGLQNSPVPTSQNADCLQSSPVPSAQQALSLSIQSILSKSLTPPSVLSPASVLTTPKSSEHPPYHVSKLSVLPTDFVHSPITAGLQSPNSSNSGIKSTSLYHSALSSMEQSNTDTSVIKRILLDNQPEQKVTHGTSKSFQNEQKLTCSLDQVNQDSSQAYEKQIFKDKSSFAERTPYLPKSRKSSQQSKLPSHHSSPQLTLGPGQQPKSPTSQRGLVSSSQLHSLIKHRVPTPGLAPISPAEPPHSYRSAASELYKELSGSMSIPAQNLKSLSLTDAENFRREHNKAQKLTDQQQASLSRSRPPPLSRSSSLPGYFTTNSDVSFPSYLSPPACSVSPFFPGGRQSPQMTHQPFNLHTSLLSLFHSSAFPSCHPFSMHPDIASLSYPNLHFPGISPRFSPSHLQISSASTLFPPNLSPQTYATSHLYKQQKENAKTPPRQTLKGAANEQTLQESRLPKSSSPVASSHHLGRISKSVSQSPIHHQHQYHQKQQRQQQSPKNQAKATSQLQNLMRIAQQVPLRDELCPAVTQDYSPYQKQDFSVQSMVESILTTSRAPQPVSVQGLLYSKADSAPETGKKRTHSGGSKVTGVSASKRGPKRKMDEPGSDDWANAYKRRSTRSRNVKGRKEEKSIDYQELMKKHFPHSLLHLEKDSDVEKNEETNVEMFKNDNDDCFVTENYSDISTLKKLVVTENYDVRTYVRKCLKGHGILDLIYKFLLNLAQRCDCVWYEGLPSIYMKLYERLRKHLTVPTFISSDDDTFTPEGLKEYATIILTWAELSLNRATAESGEKSFVLPSRPGQPDNATQDCLGQFHKEDMLFLLSLAGQHDTFRLSHGEFCIRLYWLKAKQHQLFNQIAEAVDCFEIVSELLGDVASETASEKNKVRITLANVSQDRVISLSEARRQLECLQRSKSLEDTQKLYNDAKFDQVVENLVYTFNDKSLSPKSVVQRERPSQLMLLINSLFNTKRSSECIQWAEASLHEAVMSYKKVSSAQLRKDWSATLESLFTTMDRILDENEAILSILTHRNLVRLAHGLVSVIEIILDVGDFITEMPIGSVRPWKILYRVLRCEEINNDRSKEITGQEPMCRDGEKDNADIRPSIAMLREAHDHLGRHSWCTKDEGLLLLFIMSVVEQEMEGKNDDDLEELIPIYEQCIYCLYGHPNKRVRARHLNDHNASPVVLTWQRAGPVFHHFVPQSVPEFDSYRTSTVTADVENLLRRIFSLVPEKINPAQGLSEVTDYIEGVRNVVPKSFSVDKETDPYNISNLLYYLLADFYFKSKEPNKAVKFYQLDLVLNINRLDSWAGLGLAKTSQIVQKLNSTELKIEKPIQKNSEAALRCFRRAVELESGSRKLWLEYGSLAYQLHSHASRQIKYQNMFSLCDEILQLAVTRKKEMLNVAKNSYLQASKCEGDGTEEDWLAFYMMGKVAEKQQEDPSICLEHYKQAALCLHEEKAVYPKKIPFVNPRPHLALEALEMFYRIQVCALKLVLSGCGYQQMCLLNGYVTDAFLGNFARGEEKQQKVEEDEREELFILPQPASTVTTISSKPRPVYHKNPTDHEYSRSKGASDSHLEGDGSKDQNLANVETGTQSSEMTPRQSEADENQVITVGASVELGTSTNQANVELGTSTNQANVELGSSTDQASVELCTNPNQANVELGSNTNQAITAGTNVDLGSSPNQAVTAGANVELGTNTNQADAELGSGTNQAIVSGANVELATSPNQAITAGSNVELSSSTDTLSTVKPQNPDASVIELMEGDTTGLAVINRPDLGDGSQSKKSVGSYDTQVKQENVEENMEVDADEEPVNVMSERKMDIHNEEGNCKSDVMADAGSDFTESEKSVDMNESSQKECYPSSSSCQVYGKGDEKFELEGNASVGEAGVLSCRSEADVDTDEMDVDNPASTSCQLSQSSITSSQVHKPEQAAESCKSVEDVFQVHAGENPNETEAAQNSPSDLHRAVSEGFVPSTENHETDPDKLVDINKFKSTDENVCVRDMATISQEIPAATITCNSASSTNLVDENKSVLDVESAEKDINQTDSDIQSLSDENVDFKSASVNESRNLKVEEDVQFDQEQKSEKSLLETSEPLCEEADIIKPAGGDLIAKDQGLTMGESHHVDDSGKDTKEDEKWETEYKEKSNNSTEHHPMEISDVTQPENTTGKETFVSAITNVGNSDVPQSNLITDSSPAKMDSEATNTQEINATPQQDPELLRAEIISKCRAGLEMCASRFSSHYKSLYRLAHMYYHTKELDKARDLLLGRSDWQEQSHMPAPGLFSERKQNNFFQGLWKIPVEDIDRSGCFTSHVHRSVCLLLEVLCDLGDLEMLKNLHAQLRRTPEPGKKYLRDAERLVLAEETYFKCATVVQQDMEVSDHWSEEQREENLSRVYHIWLAGKGCKHLDKVTDALHRAFKIMMKGRTDVNRLTAAQAISFCQQNLSKPPTISTPASATVPPRPSNQTGTDKVKTSLVLSLERVELEKAASKQSEPPAQQNINNEDAMETDHPANLHSLDANSAVVSLHGLDANNAVVSLHGQDTASSETSRVDSIAIPALPDSAAMVGQPEGDVIVLSD